MAIYINHKAIAEKLEIDVIIVTNAIAEYEAE
jgi:hypothetical protein